MMKMEIKLDEAKIAADGKYTSKAIWDYIDKVFQKSNCTKESLTDGAVLYTGDTATDDHLGDFMAVHWTLSESKVFAKYCVKWILYDNDDDENLPFQDMDVLEREWSEFKNPLFMR